MKPIALLLAVFLTCGASITNARTVVRGVSLISMVDEAQPVLANMDVLIEHGRFQSISPSGSSALPADATVLDGTGLFMIPGLADCHVHFNFERSDSAAESQYVREDNDVLRKLFVAHGVTFVRSMWGSPAIVELRDRCNSGELIGPTILTTGPLLTDNSTPPARQLSTEQDLDDVLREHQEAGYDALKIHSSPNPAALRSLLGKAAAAAIPVYGHMPFTIDRMEILAQPGLTTIEHLSTLLGACVRDDSDALNSNWPGMMRMFADQDPAKQQQWATVAAESGKWFCPTIMTSVTDQYTMAEYNELLDELSGTYVTPRTIDYWRNAVGYEKQTYEQAGIDLPSLYQANCDLLSAFIATNVPIIAGTDTPVRPGVAGALLHRELAEYVRLGMTPLHALQTATTNAAQALGQAQEFGQIAPGYRADAILLKANPLDDIENLQHIESVLLRGQVIDRNALDALLGEVKNTVADSRNRKG